MKILVVRFSSIGDVILTTPVVRCLAQQVPGAVIHFITKKAFLPLLDNNPHIRRIITIEKSVTEVLPALKAEKYDVVIDLHRNVRTLRLKWALGRKSFSFPKENFAKLLLVWFKWNRMPGVHVVDRYFETVRQLGVVNDQQPIDLFLRPEDGINLSEYGLAEKQFIAVAMGAQFATKQLPVELMASVLNDAHLPIVLLGGPTDCERAEALKNVLKTQQIIDFCGKIELRTSGYVLSQAKVLLAGDTGLMHIATAFRVPIVSVWGNTVPAFGMYPYMPLQKELFSIHEVPDLPCRPCSKIGFASCPKKHFHCMTLHDAGAIRRDLEGRS